MKKIGIKCCASALTLSLIFTGTMPTFAAEPLEFKQHQGNMLKLEEKNFNDYNMDTIVDNEFEKTVITEEDGKTIRSTFDKVNQIVTITTEGEEEPIIIDLSNAEAEAKGEDFEMGTLAVISEENTWMNYEYTYSTGKKWQLRRPDPSNPIFKTLYIDRTETTTNSTDLLNFKSSVDLLNKAEGRYILNAGGVGIGTAATLIAGALSGGTAALAVALFSAGIVDKAFDAGMDMGFHAENAHFYYFRVL